MVGNKSISFAEFRQVLVGLGFTPTRADRACVLHHPTEGLLVFRVYQDAEAVDERDLVSARKFLDLRGLLNASDFNALVRHATTSA
jgi:hypothetical protein